jgi:hypothetical protein
MMTAEHAAAPRAKAAFATQAGALLRKNARYQQKNWCALQRFPASARPRVRYASRLTAPLPAGKRTAASCSRRSSSPSSSAVRTLATLHARTV